jgi:hypothetical protein
VNRWDAWQDVYDNIIRINHHPQFVLKAFMGSISGFASLGLFYTSVDRANDFVEQLDTGYFDEVLDLDARSMRKTDLATERENRLLDLIRDNIGNRFTVSEVLGLAYTAHRLERSLLKAGLMDILESLTLSESESAMLEKIRGIERRELALKPVAEKRERTRAVPATIPPKKAPRARAADLETQSRLLKWLSVSVGSYRVMPDVSRQVRSHTPFRVELEASRFHRLRRFYRDDRAMREMLDRFQRILQEDQPADSMDLEAFQNDLFRRIYEIDTRIRSRSKARGLPVPEDRPVRVVRGTAPSGVDSALVDLRSFGDRPLTRGETMTLLMKGYADATGALRLEVQRTRLESDIERKWFYESFVIVVDPGQETLLRQLESLGLGGFVHATRPRDESRETDSRVPRNRGVNRAA